MTVVEWFHPEVKEPTEGAEVPEHYGDEAVALLARSMTTLRRTVAGLLGLLLVAMVGLVWLAWRPSLFPYLVVVDPQGQVLWQGVPGDYTIPELYLMNEVQRVIKLARVRSDDPVVNTQNRAEALAMTTGQANIDMNEYIKAVRKVEQEQASNPMRVTVTPTWRGRVGPQGTHEYRFTWTETWTPTVGHGSKVVAMEGTFKVRLRPKQGPLGLYQITVEDMQASAFGVKIEWFVWSTDLKGGSE